MPVRTSPPTIAVKEATNKIVARRHEQETFGLFIRVVLGLGLLHLAIGLALGGIPGYINSWRAGMDLVKDMPFLIVLLPLALASLFMGIQMWRNPEVGEVQLPPFPPVDDLRFNNQMYVGSAWTRGGKQPGDVYDPEEDELLGDNPHIILKEIGLFGNLHVKGGVGGGKTATFIMPFLHQAINKYPKPPRLDDFKLGTDGRFEKQDALAGGLGRLRKPKQITSEHPKSGPIPEEAWRPYDGKTPEEAKAIYEDLLQAHLTKKWGLFVIDPKGDMTEQIQRMAALAGREEDIFVLRPHGEYTYNALDISPNSLVQSEMVMDGIEAVAGQAIQQYWRQTQSEWLSNALTILAVVDPRSKNFKGILKFARNESLRTAMVAEAEAIMKEAQAEEERCRRIGQPYYGVRVQPTAVDFFKQWDDSDTDIKQKQAVVSGIQAQAKFFVEEELAEFLCPEMPPTFPGFDEMIDKGHIVVLQMPIGKWSAVAKVLGILVLADAQQAGRDRINKLHLNQERVVAFVVDEIASYLNKLTKEFISINRQSRICFVASHQSQGQLLLSDRGFETSFNDNLRTKISYSAPHADSARKESALFGARQVYKESWSQSKSFTGVKTKDEESFTPGGPQSEGASMRVDEIEKPWFPQEDFMSLTMGELIISEFDGTTTLSPRRIMAPAYFKSPSKARADALSLNLDPMSPHPVIVVRDPAEYPESRDHELIIKALDMTGYVVIEPLLNTEGTLCGLRMITDVGTLVVPAPVIERLGDDIRQRLADPQTLVLLGDLPRSAEYLGEFIGVDFNRVLGLVDLFNRVFPGKSESKTVASLVKNREKRGRICPTEKRGGWEAHLKTENLRKIREDSRQIIGLFVEIGEKLDGLDEDILNQWHVETQAKIRNLLSEIKDLPIDHAETGAEPLIGTAEEFAEEAVQSSGDPDLVARFEAGDRGGEGMDETSLGGNDVDVTENPYSMLTPETLNAKNEGAEEEEGTVELRARPDARLPKMLRRKKKDKEKTLDQLTEELDADRQTDNEQSTDSKKSRKGTRAKRSPKSDSAAGRRDAGAAGRAGGRKKDRSRLDLGLDADGEAMPATQQQGSDPQDGDSDLLSGAPLN